jgi:hypothetical protein
MVAVAERAVALGFPALKVRFGRPELTDDLAVVTAVRCATGDRLDSWSTATRAGGCRGHAGPVGRRAGHGGGRCWRPRASTGWRSRSTAGTTPATPSCGAGCRCGSRGRMTREPYEFAAARAGCLDVFQPDCVCTGDHRAELAARCGGGRSSPPHVGQRHRPAGQPAPGGRDGRHPFIEFPSTLRSGPRRGGTSRWRRRSRSTATAGSSSRTSRASGCTSTRSGWPPPARPPTFG